MRKKIKSIFEGKKLSAKELESKIKSLVDRQKEIDDTLVSLDEQLAIAGATGESTEEILNEIAKLEATARSLPRSVELLRKEYNSALWTEAEANRQRLQDEANTVVKKIQPLYKKIETAIKEYTEMIESLELDNIECHSSAAEQILQYRGDNPLERFQNEANRGISQSKLSDDSRIAGLMRRLDDYEPQVREEPVEAAV